MALEDQVKIWLNSYLASIDESIDADVYTDYLYEIIIENESESDECIENVNSLLSSLINEDCSKYALAIFENYNLIKSKILNQPQNDEKSKSDLNKLVDVIKNQDLSKYKRNQNAESQDNEVMTNIEGSMKTLDMNKKSKLIARTLLAQECGDKSDSDDELTKGISNNNRENVARAEKEYRERQREAAQKKKEKDKNDLKAQKESKDKRKETEKKRTQKRERRR